MHLGIQALSSRPQARCLEPRTRNCKPQAETLSRSLVTGVPKEDASPEPDDEGPIFKVCAPPNMGLLNPKP